MTARIALSLVLHNHQPVGNFESVIALNHDLAYRPLLEALERHPGVHLSLHYSGSLLRWLRAERPQSLERLGELVERGQVELLGGGYYEPVLASLPEADRLGQLVRMADELERLFGRRPRGAWLTERVWEPDVPASLAGAGYEWTVLDDAHFRGAAIPEEGLWNAYTTDDQGKRLTIFGTEQGLRYRIPFGDMEDVVAYLREHATEDGRRVGTMGDDGEKFGAWPTTWEQCWGAGRWVDRFFDALQANSAWLSTVTPSGWLEREQPVGRAYVPTSSYAEMGEWALPADEAEQYARVLREDLAAGRPEPRWMRGGFWRNYLAKYREVNDLHKQMLRTSAKVATMQPGPTREIALDHLYQGQSNDCYWHGVFGGIYLSHMRLATFEHLIAAEDLADLEARERGQPVDGVAIRDLDLDGRDELLLSSPGLVVALKPSEGAGIGSWDVRAVRHALTAVLRRRREAYHARLLAFDGHGSVEGATTTEDAGGSAASIHELVHVHDPGLARLLRYDAYERRSGLVHILDPGTTRDAFAALEFAELGDFLDQPFTIEGVAPDAVTLLREGRVDTPTGRKPLHVRKVVRRDGDRRAPQLSLAVELHNPGRSALETTLAVEWSLTLLGGGGNPAAYYRVGDAMLAHDSSGGASLLETIEAGNRDVGLSVVTEVSPAADVWWFSIDTVSQSEYGFERTHQGSCLTFVWPVHLAPGERMTVSMANHVSTSRDRAAEEVSGTEQGDVVRTGQVG